MATIVGNNELQPEQQSFEQLRFSHDNLATEAFEQLLGSSTVDRNLYVCLLRQNDSDPSLKAFWSQATTVPPWVDWAQVRRGQLVFNRYILPIALGFAFQGFAGEIAAATGPAEVLVRAGGLSSKNISQRIAQTLQWLMDATESLASIQPGGKGHASTIQIRLLHARVRHRIAEVARVRPGYYDFDRHGTPVNTHDTILTLAFFCCKPIWVQFPQLWVYPRAKEIDDFVALWRYLGHLLGLPSEHFASATIAKQTMCTLDREKRLQSEASQQITNAFLDAFADRTPYNLSRGFLQAGIRTMNPASTCDVLKVPKVALLHNLTFASLKAFVAFVTLTQKRIPFFDMSMQKVSVGKVPMVAVVTLTKNQVLQKQSTRHAFRSPKAPHSVVKRLQISCSFSRQGALKVARNVRTMEGSGRYETSRDDIDASACHCRDTGNGCRRSVRPNLVARLRKVSR